MLIQIRTRTNTRERFSKGGQELSVEHALPFEEPDRPSSSHCGTDTQVLLIGLSKRWVVSVGLIYMMMQVLNGHQFAHL